MTYHPNLQPFQGQPASYHAGDGMNTLMEFKARAQAAGVAWLGYRAGKNFYEIHPNAEEAIIHGMHAARRWYIWIFFLNWWLFSAAFLGWMFYLKNHEVRGEDYPFIDSAWSAVTTKIMIFIIPAFIGVLVTYCRNVDYSLFRRRFVYKLVKPITLMTNRIPNWLMYSFCLCMLFFPFPLANEPAPPVNNPIAAVSAVSELCETVTTARANGETTLEISDAAANAAGLGDDIQGWYIEHC